MGNFFGVAPRASAAPVSAIGWETRYDGVLSVAIIDNVPFAGISGPWPDGNYALTWWSAGTAEAPPTLEFHPSMDAARNRVEQVAGIYLHAA